MKLVGTRNQLRAWGCLDHALSAQSFDLVPTHAQQLPVHLLGVRPDVRAGVPHEIVVVDDGSSDGTWTVLQELKQTIPTLAPVQNKGRHGFGHAVIFGLNRIKGDACTVMMADASDAPEHAVLYWRTLNEGWECVFGSRFREGGRNLGTLRRRVISRGGTALTNVLLGTRLTDMTSGFQLFTRAALEDVLASGIRAKGPFFQTEMKTFCRRLRVAEIPIEYSAGSHRVGRRAITESLINLCGLFRRRVAGEL